MSDVIVQDTDVQQRTVQRHACREREDKAYTLWTILDTGTPGHAQYKRGCRENNMLLRKLKHVGIIHS